MTKRLDGKVAFITGAGSGIAKAAAQLFSREGARVVIVEIDAERGRNTESLVREAGGEALFIETDVRQEESVKRAVAVAIERFGKIDVLYNCAGGSTPEDDLVTTVDLSVWQHTMSLDLFGAMLCCRNVIPRIIESGGGAVVLMSSGAALRGASPAHVYTAAKGAILSLTRALAGAYAKDNVRVNAICAGRILTERITSRYGTPEQAGPVVDLQDAAGRVKEYPFWVGKPEDIANIALFLASDEARMITGAAIPADGGRSAYRFKQTSLPLHRGESTRSTRGGLRMGVVFSMNKFKASDGLEIAYALDDFTDPWRKADTLILVHAAMGSSLRFYAWVPHLARDFRVVRIDMRGHGSTQIPGPDQLTQQRLVQDVVELADHVGAARFHVAGSSAGSIVAEKVAIDFPDRVLTLGAFAGTGGIKHGLQDQTSWVQRIGEKGLAAFLRETIADRVDLSRADPGFVEWFITESAKTPVEVLARFVPMMRRFEVLDDLHRIKCPTLAVAPGGDPIHTVDQYRVLQEKIPNCEFLVYEGLPHNITDAVPDRCAEDLKRFLLKHTDF